MYLTAQTIEQWPWWMDFARMLRPVKAAIASRERNDSSEGYQCRSDIRSRMIMTGRPWKLLPRLCTARLQSLQCYQPDHGMEDLTNASAAFHTSEVARLSWLDSRTYTTSLADSVDWTTSVH